MESYKNSNLSRPSRVPLSLLEQYAEELENDLNAFTGIKTEDFSGDQMKAYRKKLIALNEDCEVKKK